MIDLDDRFRALDTIDVPEQWADIERRAAMWDDKPGSPRRRNLLIAAVVLLAVGVGGFLALTLTAPADPPTEDITVIDTPTTVAPSSIVTSSVQSAPGPSLPIDQLTIQNVRSDLVASLDEWFVIADVDGTPRVLSSSSGEVWEVWPVDLPPSVLVPPAIGVAEDLSRVRYNLAASPEGEVFLATYGALDVSPAVYRVGVEELEALHTTAAATPPSGFTRFTSLGLLTVADGAVILETTEYVPDYRALFPECSSNSSQGRRTVGPEGTLLTGCEGSAPIPIADLGLDPFDDLVDQQLLVMRPDSDASLLELPPGSSHVRDALVTDASVILVAGDTFWESSDSSAWRALFPSQDTTPSSRVMIDAVASEAALVAVMEDLPTNERFLLRSLDGGESWDELDLPGLAQLSDGVNPQVFLEERMDETYVRSCIWTGLSTEEQPPISECTSWVIGWDPLALREHSSPVANQTVENQSGAITYPDDLDGSFVFTPS